MSDQILNILKYFLLAILWLFFLRVLRVAWVEMRTADTTLADADAEAAPRPGAVPARRTRAVPPDTAGQPAPAQPGSAASMPGSAAPMPAPAVPEPGSAPAAFLRVLEPGDLAGRTFPLSSGAVTVGRSSGSDVALAADSFVSARHARVYLEGREVWVEDLGSTNGTYVNSARIDGPVRLRPGDRVQFGRTVLEVHR